MSDPLRCSSCSAYLLSNPVQCPCGDRLCGDCYNSLKSSKKTAINCPKCGEKISLDDCFKDKAAENELKSATIKCTYKDCPWEGLGKYYMEHMASCKFKKIPCPNKQYGCPKLLLQSQWDEHLERECRFIPVQCPWCSKKVHNNETTQCSGRNSSSLAEIPQQDIQQVQEGLTGEHLNTAVGCYLLEWKIPEVQRRSGEARSGKTVSLYSAPFYTSHHGYKMCLRLYMDGDERGKGTHLSFFLTLMRGEYDALLTWPFE